MATLSPTVTHIIVSSQLSLEQAEMATRYSKEAIPACCRVVGMDWVVSCVGAGELLPTKQFEVLIMREEKHDAADSSFQSKLKSTSSVAQHHHKRVHSIVQESPTIGKRSTAPPNEDSITFSCVRLLLQQTAPICLTTSRLISQTFTRPHIFTSRFHLRPGDFRFIF